MQERVQGVVEREDRRTRFLLNCLDARIIPVESTHVKAKGRQMTFSNKASIESNRIK